MAPVEITHPVLGLMLGCTGLVIQHRDRSLPGRLYAASLYVGCVCLFLWPAANSRALDEVTNLAGLGRFVTDFTATACVILQFAFITTLSDQWVLWRRRAIAAYIPLMLLLIVLWGFLRASYGANLERLLYPGYAIHPPAVLLWNVLVGVAITYVSVLGVFGYAYAVATMPCQRYPRAVTGVGVIVYTETTIYGLLVLGQLAASASGVDRTGQYVVRFTAPLVIVCVIISIVTTGYLIIGQALVAYVREWFSLTRKQRAINRALADVLNALATASDMRAFLGTYEARGFVRAVDEHCKAHHIPTYRRRCAREATRIVLPLIGTPRGAADAADIEDAQDNSDDPRFAGTDDQALLVGLSRRAQEDVYFIGDSNRIATLVILDLRGSVIASDHIPEMEPRREPNGWRREVAALIVEVVHARAHTLMADRLEPSRSMQLGRDAMETIQ